MSNTYKNIPDTDAGGTTHIASTSDGLVVSPDGSGGWLIGLDATRMVADRASAVVTSFTAGETISALQAVYESGGAVFKGSHTALDEANVVGVSLTAASPGDTLLVLQYGVLDDPSLSFNPADLLFLTTDGLISTTAPTTGYLTRIGRAINSHAALVIIDSPKAL